MDTCPCLRTAMATTSLKSPRGPADLGLLMFHESPPCNYFGFLSWGLPLEDPKLRQMLSSTPLTINTHQGDPPPQSLGRILQQLRLGLTVCSYHRLRDLVGCGGHTSPLHVGMVADAARCRAPAIKQQETTKRKTGGGRERRTAAIAAMLESTDAIPAAQEAEHRNGLEPKD